MYKFKIDTSDLDELFKNLTQFHQDFALNFCTKTSNVEQHSLKYLHGILIEQGRSNMVKYAKKVPDTDNQALQNPCIDILIFLPTSCLFIFLFYTSRHAVTDPVLQKRGILWMLEVFAVLGLLVFEIVGKVTNF